MATFTESTYNGWTNYETWNVALWLGNNEGLYNFARSFERWTDLAAALTEMDDTAETGDGVRYDDPTLDHDELQDWLTDL